MTHNVQKPTFAQALRFWHLLGWINFGGPAAQIALMQQELVERRRWLGRDDFLHGLNFCMLLPGPEAQQLATYAGWRLHGWRGAAVAGSLFILPGAFVLMILSYLAAAHGEVWWVRAIFDGLKPVVLAVVLAAILRLMRKSFDGVMPIAFALGALAALLLGVPFPVIILMVGVIGVLAAPHAAQGASLDWPRGSLLRVARLAALFAGLWLMVVLPILWFFDSPAFSALARLFTGAAFVTFGGAYAVLPYIADKAVNDYGWLNAAEMINGLALAETTPGPLIMVLQYVGFFAGWNAPGSLSPVIAGILGGLLTTYVTFLPSFFFILAGAPMLDVLRHWPRAQGALRAISAAVVGVMMSLALFFGQAILWPDGAITLVGFQLWTAVLTAGFWLLLAWRNWPIHRLVLIGGGLGLGAALIKSLF